MYTHGELNGRNYRGTRNKLIPSPRRRHAIEHSVIENYGLTKATFYDKREITEIWRWYIAHPSFRPLGNSYSKSYSMLQIVLILKKSKLKKPLHTPTHTQEEYTSAFFRVSSIAYLEPYSNLFLRKIWFPPKSIRQNLTNVFNSKSLLVSKVQI